MVFARHALAIATISPCGDPGWKTSSGEKLSAHGVGTLDGIPI
jgi:hypothetical protein